MSSNQSNVSRKMANMSSANVAKDVQDLIAKGYTEVDNKLLQTLRKKYSDNDIVDTIIEQLADRVALIREKAEKFGRAILKHSNANIPFHTLLNKAIAYKNHPKFKLSDAEFEFFNKFLHQTLQGRKDENGQLMINPINTNLSRVFGAYESQMESMNVEQGDMQYVQQILRQHAASRPLHANIVMQSMMYRDMAPEAITGQYDSTKHNAACHISAVIAAMFLPKIELFEEMFLRANIAYIVRCRYEKSNKMTQADYKLMYALVSDPNDIVCDIESPFKDLLNRVMLQETLWQSVYALRNGRYYDCQSTQFMAAVDNCKISTVDAPDTIYLGDEATVMRRLLQAFSLRPIIVNTTPIFGNTVLNNNANFPVNVNRVTAIPMITVRLPILTNKDTEPVSLVDSLNAPQYHFENGGLVPKVQTIIYTRGVVIYHVARRVVNPDFRTIIEPSNWVQSLPTISGYERVNPREVTAEPFIDIGYDTEDKPLQRLYLRSVVAVNVNPAMPDLIVGTSALFVRQNEYVFGANATKYSMYNPQMAAIRAFSDEAEDKYQFQPPYVYLTESSEDKQYMSFYHLSAKYGTIYIYSENK